MTAPKPPTMSDAIARYGYLGQLAASIPELKKLLDSANAGAWTPDKFQYEVQNSTWWKTTPDTQRQIDILKATDPDTWRQNLSNAAYKVQQIAVELGISLDRGQAEKMAFNAIAYGWDDTTLRNQVGAGALDFGSDGHMGGTAADLRAQLKQSAYNYGVVYSDGAVTNAVKLILSGKSTLGSFEAQFRSTAKSTYPSLATELDSGMTVRDAADPYISLMAQTLEMPEGDIQIFNPVIKSALQGAKAKDGSVNSQPLWEFEKKVKSDPRWDKTKNAQESAVQLATQIGKDWGFMAT